MAMTPFLNPRKKIERSNTIHPRNAGLGKCSEASSSIGTAVTIMQSDLVAIMFPQLFSTKTAYTTNAPDINNSG